MVVYTTLEQDLLQKRWKHSLLQIHVYCSNVIKKHYYILVSSNGQNRILTRKKIPVVSIWYIITVMHGTEYCVVFLKDL